MACDVLYLKMFDVIVTEFRDFLFLNLERGRIMEDGHSQEEAFDWSTRFTAEIHFAFVV